MDRIRSLIFVFIFMLSAFGQTQQSSVNTLHSQEVKNSFNKLSFILPSFVIHGLSPHPVSAEAMPRRLDSAGNGVVTPGAGFEFLDKKTGFLFLAAVIKDCYDNMAGTIQVGSSMNLGHFTHLGLTMGIYARETPLSCRTVRTRTEEINTFSINDVAPYTNQNECIILDSLSEKFMANIGSSSVDIIPMPFVQFSTALYKSRDLQIDLKFMSNYFLNEVAFGIPF